MELQVDPELRAFVAAELLPGLGLDSDWFWARVADLHERFADRTAGLLARRDRLQERIDEWHRENGPGDPIAYQAFLTEIGYLLPPAEPVLQVSGVDREIAEVPGPQLVVPATVPRYALNAANARWGSLLDALYGTDVLPLDRELAAGYDERRGEQVIAEVDRLLDEFFPLAEGGHADTTGYRVAGGALVVDTPKGETALAEPGQLVGYRSLDLSTGDPAAILLRRHGLHVEIGIDRAHQVGRLHHAGVADVLVEAAVTTIVDLEDSVATVDGPDKVAAYRSWLGLMTGELTSSFEKGGHPVERRLRGDRSYVAPDGAHFTLPGRALLLVRTVGHHMHTDSVRTPDGEPIGEGLLDALIAATAMLYDLRRLGRYPNSRTGSGYLVKPKMHGPDEVALTVDMLDAAEEALGLDPNTIKIGIMDEERRTSVNLEACIAAAERRVIFVNTGFLDRTADEIHTDFEAGPVVRKQDMKSASWLSAYEDRNVDVALRAGFAGQAQIGKGMWTKPGAMAEMLATKAEHLESGANTAWVPSPTAATLHALHYLRVDPRARQRELADRPLTDRRELLVLPVLPDGGAGLDAATRQQELGSNAQAILGYVVRWVALGIGCSTVPDLGGVGLMEDRATLRISSQHIANWLHHGVVDEQQVRDAFGRMAALVDQQNAEEPGYRPMSGDPEGSESFRAALELVFTGRTEPAGYTERALTGWRRRAKAAG